MWGASADAPHTIQRHLVSADPVPAYEPQLRPARPRRDEIGEVYAPSCSPPATTCTRTGLVGALGLSGGIDSALVATIAVDALGADRVHGVLMPSRYSTDHSVTDAEELARRQGINARIIPVAPLRGSVRERGESRRPRRREPASLVRGQLLMTLSNQEGHLVLTTGNKSELVSRLLHPLRRLRGRIRPHPGRVEDLVWELARWRNAEAERNGQVPPIPEHSITKPPSAELRPGQLDTDSLPEYDVLDALLDDYVGTDLGRDELVAAGHDPELVDRVIRMVDRAEYTRRQYPPGPKISTRNFGRDRRVPITSRWTV